MGPKTALRASQDLGISSPEELELSIESGDFEKLPRVGPKNAQRILQQMRSQRLQSGRWMLGSAVPVGEQIAEYLRAHCSGATADIAGGVRRGCETVTELVLVATSDDPDDVLEAFAAHPDVATVKDRNSTSIDVSLNGGLAVSLTSTKPDIAGSVLMKATGPESHWNAIQKLACEAEFDLHSMETTGLNSETAIYHKLGVGPVPPELRESVEMLPFAGASAFTDLLQQSDIRGDLHVHSDWSDGRTSIDEMVDAATQRDLEYVALTDHSVGRAVANGLSIERLAAHNREIDRINREVSGIIVLKGTEVDIRADGSLDYDGDVLSDLDIVIASIHSAMGQESDVMTNRLISAMRNPYVTAIGHLTTRLLWDGLRSRDPISFDTTAILEAAADTGTLLENNSSPKRLDLKDGHIRSAREHGVKFLLNTDSHRPTSLADVRYGVTTARRAGCKRQDIANTLPQQRFLDFLSFPKHERQGFLNAVA